MNLLGLEQVQRTMNLLGLDQVLRTMNLLGLDQVLRTMNLLGQVQRTMNLLGLDQVQHFLTNPLDYFKYKLNPKLLSLMPPTLYPKI